MSATIDSVARAVLELTTLGPIFPCRQRSKAPLTVHGFKDASIEASVILGWHRRWPDANWAIATGAPGPTVVDIDDPRAVPDLVAQLDALGAPCAATSRGRHYHCRGTDAGTVKLERDGHTYGERRGRGSYVLAPPSIHPSGRVYAWLVAPTAPLPEVPAMLESSARPPAGVGDQALVDHVAPGAMYDHLLDLSVRLARVGVYNADVVERVLLAEFDAVRVPGASYGDPIAGRRDTRRIAEWANRSRIADRERAAGSWSLCVRRSGG